MTRIAFAADLHIDAYGSRIDPLTGMNARLLDYLRTTRSVAQAARDREAEALVIAGDFTERKHVNDWLLGYIGDALSDGPRRQILVRGNHDAETAGESKVSVLGRMAEGRTTTVAAAGLDIVGDVVIASLPYLDRHWLRARAEFHAVPDAEVFRVLAEQFVLMAQGLYAQAKATQPDKACVLVCHQTLAGAAMSDSQRAFLGDVSLVIDSRALAAIGFEAVVAGHLHRHQVVVPGSAPVLYAGSIERVDFGEEHEDKGFIVADVAPGRFDWEFVPTDARRYVTLRGEQYLDNPADADVEGAVVRVQELPPEADHGEVRRALEGAGAFEVASITAARRESTVAEGVLSETLAPVQALEQYFAADPQREVLVGRGRELLAEVA